MLFGDNVEKLTKSAEIELKDMFDSLSETEEFNQLKVLSAMQDCRLSDTHFAWNTGYAYGDRGRDITEEIYARIFKAEDAIVRPQIVSGTHALSLCLTGILRPGDTLYSVSGKPYDTLHDVIGISGENGSSLMELGVKYRDTELLSDGSFNTSKILETLENTDVKMLYIQRSSGYSFRKPITITSIENLIREARKVKPDVIVMVDNCYGEFIEKREPIEVGADLIAGSLIKNPGGGLAVTGGYIAGNEKLIELVSHKLTSPGIGKEVGVTFGLTRQVLQGLFMAPHVVHGALRGAALVAKVFESLGYEVSPGSEDTRSDIIQAVKLGDKDKVIAFCQGIQAAAPVDSMAVPVPWDMPGYESEVIMAAGTFIQGSSIELSADAPIREPYVVYFQGGLNYNHSKIGLKYALSKIL